MQQQSELYSLAIVLWKSSAGGKIEVTGQRRDGRSLLRQVHTLQVEEPELDLHVGQDAVLLLVVRAVHLPPEQGVDAVHPVVVGDLVRGHQLQQTLLRESSLQPSVEKLAMFPGPDVLYIGHVQPRLEVLDGGDRLVTAPVSNVDGLVIGVELNIFILVFDL